MTYARTHDGVLCIYLYIYNYFYRNVFSRYLWPLAFTIHCLSVVLIFLIAICIICGQPLFDHLDHLCIAQHFTAQIMNVANKVFEC